MSALYVVEAAVIAVAVVGMFWLRRAADRAWQRHQEAKQISEGFVRVRIALRDNLTPALQKAAAAIRQMEPQMRALGEAMKKDAPS